ncbi:MAG TPA: glycoside hydrolase family 18 protein [Chitinolyticbacter sp.]|nr:glycoside hydrolase family 18 protein [Chitinolyticbacter sp.]
MQIRNLLLGCVVTAVIVLPRPGMADDDEQARHTPPLEVSAYIRTWPMPDGDHWRAGDIDGKAITQLTIAFAALREDGEVYLPETEPRIGSDGKPAPVFKQLWQEVAKLQHRYPKLKINLAIGGWGADGFSQMALTPEGRARFVQSAVRLVEQHKLSGLGIEWQYPVGPDWGQPIKSDPRDKDNYPLLIEETRAALDALGNRTQRRYQLTTAVPAGPWFAQKNELARVARSVDYLTVTAYGAYGSWSANTGHFSNLYQRTDDPAYGGWSSDQAMRVYLDAGIAPAKLLMGVPFYGPVWTGVTDVQNGLFQQFKATATDASWSEIKANYLRKSGYTRYWDATAKAPWLYNGDTFVSYEDPESLREKVRYLRQQGLGGLTIWEYAHDPNGELLSAIAQAQDRR